MPQALAGVATVVVLYWTVRRSVRPGRGDDRRRRHGADPGRRPDLPLQQPGRDPDPAPGSRRRRADPGAPDGPAALGHPGGGCSSGLGFDAKYLQAYLVLPAFALTYAVAAPGSSPPPDRRSRGGGGDGPRVARSGGSAIVELIPTDPSPVHRREHDRLGRPAAPRLRRARPHLRSGAAGMAAAERTSRGPPGSSACSTPSSPARSPG